MLGLAACLLKQLGAGRPLLLAGSRLLGGQQRGDNIGRVHPSSGSRIAGSGADKYKLWTKDLKHSDVITG